MKCPWCEAEPRWRGLGYVHWQCESTAELRAGRLADDLPKTQSSRCRVRELEAEVARLRAENTKLDAALRAKFRIRTTSPLMNGLVAIGCDEGTLLATIFHLMGELDAAREALEAMRAEVERLNEYATGQRNEAIRLEQECRHLADLLERSGRPLTADGVTNEEIAIITHD